MAGLSDDLMQILPWDSVAAPYAAPSAPIVALYDFPQVVPCAAPPSQIALCAEPPSQPCAASSSPIMDPSGTLQVACAVPSPPRGGPACDLFPEADLQFALGSVSGGLGVQQAAVDITSASGVKRKSFSETLTGLPQAPRPFADFDYSKQQKPCLKGDVLAVKISEDEYQASIAECVNLLHGRIFLSKGDKPYQIKELKEKLSKLWKISSDWSLVSLGKGFFEFSFVSNEDFRRVWSLGSRSLQPGVLRLYTWRPDFDPISAKQTNAQCWVRLHGLSREYWRSKILFEISGSLGAPIALDEATKKRTFGHFARVLIDVDFSEKLHDQLLVEREGYAFLIRVEYESVPPFCNSCRCIGHSC